MTLPGSHPLVTHNQLRLAVARACRLYATAVLWVLFCASIGYAQFISVTGVMAYPDGTPFNGKVKIQYARPTATQACTGSAQIVPLSPVTVAVTNGTLGTLSLYQTPCLVPTITNPTITPGTAAGKGATTGNMLGYDLGAGGLLTTGTGTTAGVVATIKFGQIYKSAPKCIIFWNSVQYGIGYETTTLLLKLIAKNPLAQSTIFTYAYYCALQPMLVQVIDQNNNLLYNSTWVTPRGPSTNITKLDLRTNP